ncbi:phosphatidylglycerol/phosphatidylinositol transfer protein-like [Gossypium australe]|uniref:Phosphatidylglycerol/phosphatidylinositol transfer protein-like n=1 Tax=Gossypium australe TaxID=47621 RepID=A0A5B6UNU3_9ROSI|nr:phosphatidylglycerol/phosphatidylinositol transfer protein-like [Gossypium australe]
MDTVATQLKLALLAISFLFLPFLQATDFKYCGPFSSFCYIVVGNADNGGNYVVKVNGIDISPNPVVSGKPATFSISASTGQAISGGKAVIDVSYFGFHIHQETHPLCEETSCPIAAGNFVLSHNQVLPGFTPPGSYTLKMTLTGDGIPQLTCISFNFKIGFGASVFSISDA